MLVLMNLEAAGAVHEVADGFFFMEDMRFRALL